MVEKLSWLLAAIASGFAFIGLSYLIPEEYSTLGTVFFIIGAIAVVIFAATIIVNTLTSLVRGQAGS